MPRVDRFQYPRYTPEELAKRPYIIRPVVDLLTDVRPPLNLRQINHVVEAEPWRSADIVVDHLTTQLDDCPKSRVQAQQILDNIIEPSIISLVLVHYHQ